jgi:hypothetical protein
MQILIKNFLTKCNSLIFKNFYFEDNYLGKIIFLDVNIL